MYILKTPLNQYNRRKININMKNINTTTGVVNFTFVESFQERECELCGKIQRKDVP